VGASGVALERLVARLGARLAASAPGVETDIVRAHQEFLKDCARVDIFGVKEGVLVRSVISASAAEKAGIKAGDVIVKVDETKTGAPREITSAIQAARTAGKKSVTIALFRDRKEMPVTVTLDDETSTTPRPRGTRVTVQKNEL